MRYTINLDCKVKINKDNKFPILLRVSINGKHTYFNTGRRIFHNHYDNANKCVKNGVRGYNKYTKFINTQITNVENIINESERRNEIISVNRVREIYYETYGKKPSKCFYTYVEKCIASEKKLNSITAGSLKNYEILLKRLKGYKKNLSIHDINKSFLENYHSYVINTLGLSNNSGYHSMCFLRKYTKKLFNDGLIGKYPFQNFTIGTPFLTEPEYCNPDELQLLENLYKSKKLLDIVILAKNKYAVEYKIGERCQNVLKYYLASCYCGLRFSDIKTLKTSETNGTHIVKEMQKGKKNKKKTVYIPIHQKLSELIDNSETDGKAFGVDVFSNTQTNKLLKEITKIAGITKKLTFHSARHTFAINSLMLGIKIEVVSDILGHSELITTQRYARVVDELRRQEMKKWDKRINQEETSEIITCPNCYNETFQFPKGAIQMKMVTLCCQYCDSTFSHKLNPSSKNSNKLVSLS
jgi:integrase